MYEIAPLGNEDPNVLLTTVKIPTITMKIFLRCAFVLEMYQIMGGGLTLDQL